MVWQQKTKAVVMLNRIVEKDSVKCAQYWPTKEEEQMVYEETGFCVRLKSEDVKSYYTVRQLQLENITMEKRKYPFSVDIKQVLLNMRKYRMGLIQTPDQLRFSYMAVIEGAKYIMGDSNIQNQWKELSKEDHAPGSECSSVHPNKQTTEKCNGNSVELENVEQAENLNADLSPTIQNIVDANADSAFRKRLREDRKANTAQMVQQMKHRMSEAERKRKRWLYWKPILTKIGFGSAIFIAVYSCWKLYFQSALM
ncbi:Tyrosine-protein phosphatase non-receptor type 2 [Varanus komodoensis]|nr:Tyrosine-protein phosphatase non-receptor type 2 [Varanus komodoensis]